MNTHVITQAFGVNRESYEKFIVGGKPLQGHNGLDLAPYSGQPAPVNPVDDGTVKYIGNDPGGFGLYVDINHYWGYSRYAHLSKLFNIKIGDTVYKPSMQEGTIIGLTGDTGNTWSFAGGSAVHLHLGFYPLGEPKTNGFGGCIDPAPLLVRTYQPSTITPDAPVKPVEALQQGILIVDVLSGLKLRMEHSTVFGEHYAIMPSGTKLKFTGETFKAHDGILWGKLECWAALELADGTRLVRSENRNFNLTGR